MFTDFNSLKSDAEARMSASIDKFREGLVGLRTGRASVGLLDGIVVMAYGSPTPLNQVASLSTPDARTIGVSVWDKGNVQAVEKAIRESDLGLNPATDGTLIRLPIPPLTEERRKDLAKMAASLAEDAKVAVRHIRKSAMDVVPEIEKSEDAQRANEDAVQKLTDKMIAEVDSLLKAKQADIMSIS